MIKNITLFLLVTAICLGISSFKAEKKVTEDDPNVGIYIDGIKVKEITCYTFNTLTIVWPYNSAYDDFSSFNIEANVGGLKHIENQFNNSGTAGFSKIALANKYRKGKYIVYDFFIPGSQYCRRDPDHPEYDHGTRGFMYYYYKSDKAEADVTFQLFGLSVSGYTEKYYESCSCTKKEPEFESVKIGENIVIPLKNRQAIGVYGGYPVEKKVELAPCNMEGTKVDFNNLKK